MKWEAGMDLGMDLEVDLDSGADLVGHIHQSED